MALCLEILKPEVIHPKNTLPFSQGEEFSVFVLQKEELFANKIHAYTRPRLTENSRVADLVDMVLLIENGLASDKVLLSLAQVFAASSDHQIVPTDLPEPPLSWKKEFTSIAEQRNLKISMDQAFLTVADFYSKIFGISEGRKT